jgi:cytochrome c2
MNHARSQIVAVIAAGIFGVALLAGSAAVDRTPDPRAGLKVFWDKGCIHCHPVLGQGGSIGPDLTRAPSTGDSFQLTAAMWNHAPQMWQRMQQERFELPAFEVTEMEDLFAFLAMVRSFDEPGDAKAGRQLFQSKHCADCHAIRGQGSHVGPDLYAVASNRNPVAWVAAMWNHASGMFNQLSQKGVAFPQFQGTEMVDLQSFIRSMGGVEKERQDYLFPASASRGEILFRTKQCVMCHSIGGRGGSIGPDLSRTILPRRYGEIAMVMWNHAPQMNRLSRAASVPYPNFEPQELADVLAYLNSLPTTPAGKPAAGEIAFQSKGCSVCHATTGSETSVGPNLSRLQSALTPASIARTMWNHGPKMLERMEKSSIAWPMFSSQELADTLAFLKSIQQAAPSAAPQADAPGKQGGKP